MERVDAMKLAPFFYGERAKTGMHHDNRPAAEPLLAIIDNAIHLSQIRPDGLSGFCRTYCGFHTHNTILGNDLKYAFIGNVDKCQNGCEAQITGPNSPAAGVGGIDGIANVLTHETEEAITDPDLNAWFDASGNEDADKCNFKFGPVQTAPNGSKFNQTFGGHNWLFQMEWENSRGGGCDQTLGGPFFTN